MVSKNYLNSLIEQQPIFGAKIGRYGQYQSRYIYHLSENSFDDDIEFLKNCQSQDMVASLFPKNHYSEFGFENLTCERLKSVLNVVKRLQISTLFGDLSEVLKAEHLISIDFTGPLNETEEHPSSKYVLNLESLKKLNSLSLPVNIYTSSAIDFSENVNLKELSLSHVKCGGENDPKVLNNLVQMRTLELFRYKVDHFETISHMKELRLLVCDYSRSLRDVSVLSSLSKLERVDFENCPNLINLDKLAELPNLKVLRLNKCRKIKSLSFLKNTKVECLEFFDTALEDNDLSFLNEMKNLKVVRYTHKRTYNVPRKDDLEKLPSEAWYKYTYYRDQYLV